MSSCLETPKDILPQLYTPMADEIMDHRMRGYLLDINLSAPRYPVTGPIGLKESKHSFPLKSSLVKGKPVLPPQPGEGFVHGSPMEKFTDVDRKENRYNLRLMEKTSAELRKIQRQQNERQQFMEAHRQSKDAEEKYKTQEKLEDLKMLKAYHPFGRPGFGAPRGSDKGSLIMTKNLGSKDGVGIVIEKGKTSQSSTTRPKPAADRPKVQRYEDDRMRRYRVDKNTADKYKKELDALIDVKREHAKIIRGIDKKREDSMLGYDPFGKPGAGAPNIDDRGRSSTRRSISLSYVNHPIDAVHAERMRKLRLQARGNIMMFRKHRLAAPEKTSLVEPKSSEGNPWLKLGQPTKRSQHRFPRAGDHGIYEFVDPAAPPGEGFLPKHSGGGGGDPLVDKSGEVKTKRAGLLTTIHGARRTENITKVATPEGVRDRGRLSPWGKPGAGAPLKDSEGEIVKNTKGRIQYENMGYSKKEELNMEMAKKIYRDDLQKGIQQQQEIRDEEKGYMRLPPGDVPSWFSKGMVGRPKRDPVTGIIVPQKRIMSDVTAQKFNLDRPRDVEKYYQDLQRMAGERYKKRAEEKQRLMQQDIKHIERFSTLFERPGHGAPHEKGTTRRKFSNNAIMAQEQVGNTVPRPHEKATLSSVLNLLKNSQNQYKDQESQTKTETASPCDENNAKNNNETNKGNPESVFEKVVRNPPQNPKKCTELEQFEPDEIQAKRAVSLPVNLSKCKTGKGDRHAVIEHRNTPASRVSKKLGKPFPYSVVAPWAIDA